MDHKNYLMVFNLTILFSLTQFAIADYVTIGTTGDKGVSLNFWLCVGNQFLFLLDTVLNILARGWKKTIQMRGFWLE